MMTRGIFSLGSFVCVTDVYYTRVADVLVVVSIVQIHLTGGGGNY